MGDHHLVEFVTKFHALDGDTISERKKNFNKLIRDPSFSKDKHQIHVVLDELEPKSYLESLFKVDALIYYRHTARLFEIIKGGNEVFISKILKQSWFFKEMFEDMDADSLVNDFLPCLSFTMRMKVLKKLSLVLNEPKMDEIYTFVYKRYGLWIAAKILHTCSKEKLEDIFNTEEVKLRAHQVLYLFDKSSDLFEMYVDYYRKTFHYVYTEAKTTDYIALKNPALYFKLAKEKRICVSKLGRRTTKKVYDLVKDDITKDFDRYMDLLHRPVLIKRMGSQFKTVYFARFPKVPENIAEIRSECRQLLRLYPKNRRWELFKETFLAKFPNLDINGLYSALGTDNEYLDMSRDVIVSWADYNYRTTMDDRFLKYLPPVKAIELIKEKINVTSKVYKRKEYVELLLETCNETNDLKTLEQVLSYICHRHRNEEAFFKRDLLAKIHNMFKLNELNKNHWEKINEIIKIMQIKDEFEFLKFNVFLRRHLEFLVKTGEDYKLQLVAFLKLLVHYGCDFKLLLKNPDIERKLYSEMPKYFPEIFCDMPLKDIVVNQARYMENIIDFCEENPSHYIDLGQYEQLRSFFNTTMDRYKGNEISEDIRCNNLIEKVMIHKKFFPQCSLPLEYNNELLEIIIKCRQRKFFFFYKAIKAFVLKTSRDQFENQLLKSYLEDTVENKIDKELLKWFLRNEPTVLIPYWDNILQTSCEIDFEVVKLLSHFKFDQKAVNISKAKLECDNVDNYFNAVCVLRTLLPTDEFVDLLNNSKFVPTKTKFDLEDEEMKKLYDVQCQIAKKLYKVAEPFKLLGVVLKFTVRAYLRSVLPSLRSVFYRSPEKMLYSHLDELAKKAESVRKHAVFLSCELLKQDYAVKMLTSDDTNLSSQKLLFLATLKYFKKNPSQALLDLVVKNMLTTDKKYTESLGFATFKVQKTYYGFYVEKCWKFYEDMKTNGINVDQYLENLLENVSSDRDVFIALSSSFFNNIITNYWCTNLSNNHSLRSEYLEKVFDKITASNKIIGYFVEYLLTAKAPRDFLLAFFTHWNERFDILENFEAYIMLRLLLINSECAEFKDNLAEKIVLYLEELLEKFTPYTFDLFKNVMLVFILQKTEKEKHQLLYDMIKFRSTAPVYVLVLLLINRYYHDEDAHLKNLHLIESIGKVEEPVVKIYFKKFKELDELYN